jgi:hypothetical protein
MLTTLPNIIFNQSRLKKFIIYYNEGPVPTLALKTKKRRGRVTEYRYRLWGTDASGMYIEAIIAPYLEIGLWRCVTAFPMSPPTQKAYLRRIKK